jgi:PAS domain S-box-containing protein
MQPKKKTYSRIQIPLSVALMVPFALLVMVSVGLAGAFSYRNSQAAVNQVVRELRSKIMAEVEYNLDSFLGAPQEMTQENAAFIHANLNNPQDIAQAQRFFLEQVIANPSITSLYFGSEEGGIVGAGRESADGSLYVYSTEGLKAGSFTKLSSDPGGEYSKVELTLPNFDARLRPWYQKAVGLGTATWSDIYIVFTGQELALAASRPVYDAQNNFVGVVSVDVFLSRVQQFMRSLSISPGGQSFILERSGNLIASSTATDLLRDQNGDGQAERVSILSSTDPLAKATGEFLFSNLQDLQKVDLEQSLEFRSQGDLYFVSIKPVRDPHGIDWLLVVVIPEADFMAKIQAGTFAINLAIPLAILLAGLISIFLSETIIFQVGGLNRLMRNLSEDARRDEVPVTGHIREITHLAEVFNQMGRNLQKTVADLKAEITERKQVELALSQSEERYRSLITNVPIGVYRSTPEGKLLALNPAIRQMFGLAESDDLEKENTIMYYQNPAQRAEFMAKLLQDAGSTQVELPLKRRDGKIFWGSVLSRPVFRPDGSVDYIDGTITDISDRVLADAEIQKNLKEKEVLLRELYHRTKNNMQVLISLFQLHAAYNPNPQVVDVLKEMEMRIRAMSMVHEKLYGSKNLASIHMREYVNDLAGHLVSSYRVSATHIRLAVDVDDVDFAIDTAIPCGLILNELISNALKYSFNGLVQGMISISLHRVDGTIEMSVSDDGIGAPPDFDFRKDGKMGLQTVFALAGHQLHGKVEFSSTPGVTCRIMFKDSQPEKS